MDKPDSAIVDLRVVVTRDSSKTLALGNSRITYRSMNGAVTESRHVFIGCGLKPVLGQRQLRILEIGFGTGLNALLTLIEAGETNITYEAIEPHPLTAPQWKVLDYGEHLGETSVGFFQRMHSAPWNEQVAITSRFHLLKSQTSIQGAVLSGPFHIIYFDPFDPEFQPALWTQEVFAKLFAATSPGGRLVTYSSKGIVRRAMEAAGYIVERVPGPPGKRHVAVAVRN